MGIFDRLKNAVNAFVLDEQKQEQIFRSPEVYGSSYGLQPFRSVGRTTKERSIISSIYTRMSIDVASVDIRHVRLDDQDRYLADVDSGLNNCLTVEANIDQAATAFKQDIAWTILDGGVACVVPVDTSLSPLDTAGFDILTLRVGEITQWYPRHVKVNLYNDRKGRRQEITVPKTLVAIIENPFYSVMNEPNSTLQRLRRKLSLLDAVDEQSASGKLDLIIQLPYVIKSEARRQQADQRRKDIELQLKGSQYGIAYTDGTEKITQLNRPVENNLLTQVEFLTNMLYGQLGITAEVMNGTADEKTMLNYLHRTVEPILTAIIEAMVRSFLTKTARTQKQSVMYFGDPFKLVPLDQIAELADKLSRNEIVAPNEIRGVIGLKPSKDPKADQLINSNMPPGTVAALDPNATSDPSLSTGPNDLSTIMNDAFDSVDSELTKIFADLGVDENAVSNGNP